MKVITKSNENNGIFTVSFVKNGEVITSKFACQGVNAAIRKAWLLCKDADGFSLSSNRRIVASGVGIPGMRNLEIVR